MSGQISVDPSWINSYANTVEQAGDELASVLRGLQGNVLSTTAFGQLGKEVGSASAYAKAADALQQQLSRASAALTSAATNLRAVVGSHTSADEEHASRLNQVHQG